MQATDTFKKVISAHLESTAERDPLFADTLKKPNKNIDDCITYILNEVKKSGRNGFADEEIFGMAIHYYDEDNIEAGKPIDCRVVVNQTIESTKNKQSDSTSAKSIKKANKKAAKESVSIKQSSLFS